jgi:hypothetical protein
VDHGDRLHHSWGSWQWRSATGEIELVQAAMVGLDGRSEIEIGNLCVVWRIHGISWHFVELGEGGHTGITTSSITLLSRGHFTDSAPS